MCESVWKKKTFPTNTRQKFESLFSQAEKFSFPYWITLLFYDRTEIHQDNKVYLKIDVIYSQLMSAFIDEKNRDKKMGVKWQNLLSCFFHFIKILKKKTVWITYSLNREVCYPDFYFWRVLYKFVVEEQNEGHSHFPPTNGVSFWVKDKKKCYLFIVRVFPSFERIRITYIFK